MTEPKALIYVFTGDGKGKTTSALGLTVAAALSGHKTIAIQFLKGGGYTGELFSAAYLAPFFEIYQFGHGCHIASEIKSGVKQCIKCGSCFRENRNPERGYAAQALKMAKEKLADASYSFIMLDEISHAVRRGLISIEEVLNLLSLRGQHTSIALTGRNMPEEIMQMADVVTYCQAFKHPMAAQGIDARRGIEY